MRNPLIVLKFGSSVLRAEKDLPRAVHEIYRWYREGYRVVAVVSAFAGVTDDLFAKVGDFCSNADAASTAALVATGEAHSAALLGLALDRAGVPASIVDAAAIDLETVGPTLDADCASVDVNALLRHLDRQPVAVIPGFVGRTEDGSICLLGRGGSDLTALFLAQQSDARCRLIKDVDGLYEFDPAERALSPRRYSEITYLDALELDGEIVQAKAIRFAQEHGLEFEVGCCYSESATVVGAEETRFSSREVRVPPLRVGLLGLGTVGLGVFQELLREPELFVVSGVAVLDRAKPREFPVPSDVPITDAWSVVDSDCDVVIELIGGLSPAAELVRAAIQKGKHVITANKLLLAGCGEQLHRVAEANGVELLYSAAVGGAAPMLETVRRIASECDISEIRGVLNGTCNFVLDSIASGKSREEAVRLAQARGFAEADPIQDLDGTDSAQKLALLAQASFESQIPFQEIAKQGILGILEEEIRELTETGQKVRMIARAIRSQCGSDCRVSPEIIGSDDLCAGVNGEANCLEVKIVAGQVFTVFGRGAGRWPTSEAVFADALDLWRRSALQPSVSEEELLVGGAA